MSQIILFNKPYNVLTQFTGSAGGLTLADFIKIPHVYAAGRLDRNSEGLLILTDDGALQHRLSHPKFHKKKHYWVQVEGVPTDFQLERLRQGLPIGRDIFLPAEAAIIPAPALWPREPPIRNRQSIPITWLNIVLQEGKNHQVRGMTAAIGFPTLRLIRHRIGEWKLGNLQPGEHTFLTLG